MIRHQQQPLVASPAEDHVEEAETVVLRVRAATSAAPVPQPPLLPTAFG